MTSAAETFVRSTALPLGQLHPGVAYAYASAVPAGTALIFTAGACPLDADGMTVAPGDVTAQAHQVMMNLRLALQASGADLEHVVVSTVYVASAIRDDLVAAWRVVVEHFAGHDAPSTLLGVAALGYPDQLVEVSAVAMLPTRLTE